LDSTGIGSKVGTDAAETPGSQPSLYADTDLSVGVTKDGGKPEQSGTDYEKVADINEEDDYDFGGEEEEEDPNAGEIAELRARLAELESGEEEENPFAATEEEDPFAMAGGEEEENPFGEEEDPYAGEEEGELGLEAIIRELEAQLGDEEGSEEEVPAEDPNAAQIAELRRQLAELESGEEETPAEEEPKTESKRLRESRRRLREDYTDGAEAGTDPDGEKVIDLEEILREMEDDLKDKVEEGEEEDAEELKADLNEAYKTIKSLQSTINEVNLLNAKLLFANKLFRAHNMTNEQKVKVIETLDRTKSVREVKLVYSTLAENFKYTSSNRIAKKSIAEGIASKVVKSTKPSVQKQVISESVAVANRFKKLAGIIK
jgi:hypothetical protein